MNKCNLLLLVPFASCGNQIANIDASVSIVCADNTRACYEEYERPPTSTSVYEYVFPDGVTVAKYSASRTEALQSTVAATGTTLLVFTSPSGLFIEISYSVIDSSGKNVIPIPKLEDNAEFRIANRSGNLLYELLGLEPGVTVADKSGTLFAFNSAADTSWLTVESLTEFVCYQRIDQENLLFSTAGKHSFVLSRGDTHIFSYAGCDYVAATAYDKNSYYCVIKNQGKNSPRITRWALWRTSRECR